MMAATLKTPEKGHTVKSYKCRQYDKELKRISDLKFYRSLSDLRRTEMVDVLVKRSMINCFKGYPTSRDGFRTNSVACKS